MAKTALCIGINDYPGTGQDLSGCVNDANDWKAVLEGRGFTVSQLLDQEATKAAILEAIGKLVSEAASKDLLVVTYSGHGSFVPDEDGDEPDGADEVLCPWDIELGRPITDDELAGLYSDRRRGVRIVMVSDSCNSGSVARFAPPLDREAKRVRQARFLPPSSFLTKKQLAAFGPGFAAARRAVSPPGRHPSLLLAACRDSEISFDAWFSNRPQGAFTYAALRSLKRLKPHATYRDWHKAIRKLLPTAEYPQTPSIYGTTAQRTWKIFE